MLVEDSAASSGKEGKTMARVNADMESARLTIERAKARRTVRVSHVRTIYRRDMYIAVA